jgi:HNH endonuclease
MPQTNDEVVFWSRVSIQEPDKCWIWTTRKNKGGYGNISWHNSECLSHRIAWELTNGTIPDKLNVLHSCDNPPCCNPAHLFLGTDQDNVNDMIEKGRKATLLGEDNPKHKLTYQQVEEIRQAHKAGTVSYSKLAKQYNVTKTMIGYIIRKENWMR